jgi:hypothetical protein
VLRAFRGLENASARADNLEPILAIGAALHNLIYLDDLKSQHWTSWSWCGVVRRRRTEGGACSPPGESEARDIPEVDRAAVLDGDIRYGVPLLHASRERFQSLFSAARRCEAAKLLVGVCGSEGGLPDSHHAARISGSMMATFDAGASWPWDMLWDRCPVWRYVHEPFLHLGPAAMRRERRSQAEAKQRPSRSQGEAAKLAEEGASARDQHDALFFGPKKARVKQICCIPISARVAAPLLLWACHGPVIARIEAVTTYCTVLCMQEGYDPLVDAAPPFPIRPRSSNPGCPAQSRTHSLVYAYDQGPPYWGQDCKCKKSTLPRDMASVHGILNLRWCYDPLSTKTSPHYVSKLKSLASKISCCPSIPSRGPPESVIHSFATSVEGACNFQIPSPFLLTPHRPDPSHWELRACSLASPQITEFLHKLKETAPEETLPCINPPPPS